VPTVTTYDAILSGYTWNGLYVPGRPTFLTFSFDAASSDALLGVLPGPFLDSFQGFTAAEQTLARQALAAWADVSGLTFLEVPAGQGDIRFGVYDFRLGPEDIEDNLAFAFTPYVLNFPTGAWEEEFGGDVFVDLGQATFDILVHEIGHALGMKHPFEGEIVLDPSIDDLAHTVMTYNPAGGPATGLGSLDVQAIQFLYGPATADGLQAQSWSWDAAVQTLTQAGSESGDTLAGVATIDRITSAAGNDYVMTRGGADRIDGGEGNDTLAGGSGTDTIDGGSGNDTIDGDNDGDLITGGAGDDGLWGMDGADTLEGGEGEDYISGGFGANRLTGGAGNDTLYAYTGGNTIDGGDGYDELWFAPTSAGPANLSYASLAAGGGSYTNIEAVALFGDVAGDTLQGGFMPDFLMGDAGADSLAGGGASDELYGDTGADTLSGGEGDDDLQGWSGDDVILPGAGADEIWGGTGIDTVDFSGELAPVDVIVNMTRPVAEGIEAIHEVENIVGSPFADNIIGDAGANRLFGGAGTDTIQGGDGANYLRGDDGSDSLLGGSGFDDINGNVGEDTGSGGAGDDWVVGGKDRDALSGDSGNDLVYGNLGSDTCDGGAGADTVRGGQEDDLVRGGAGDDYVSGDRGADTMTGGAGADIFHSFGVADLDRVTDFSLAEGDRVQLDPGTQHTLAQVGADTVISMTGGGQLILVGVQASALTGAWLFGA
jgi:Ca2+-binding RTX toxin-like protein